MNIHETHHESPAPTGRVETSFERANPLKEACHRLGCSRSSLYVMAGQGLIAFRKIGGRTVVMESEIMRILREAPQVDIRTRG